MNINILHNENIGQWEVWLDTEVAAKDGICLGSGDALDEAVEEARSSLAAACQRLGVPVLTPGKAPA